MASRQYVTEGITKLIYEDIRAHGTTSKKVRRIFDENVLVTR